MKILFVINEINFADHIAIGHLSSIAKELGHSTYICILNQNNLCDMVEIIKPGVVAYSGIIVGYDNIINQHKIARKKYNFVSIMGGPQATFFPELFLQSGMDAYCIGEGEYPFRDFLICINNGDTFDNIKNIITRKKSNPVRKLISNLDELPIVDRDLTISNSFLAKTSKKTFYTTRGCPYNCAYCCNNYYHLLYKNKGNLIRRFSVERVIREIEDVRSKYVMKFIKFGDDLFAFKADDWMEEFTEKYSKRINIPFNCYLRFDRINERLLTLLEKAHCFSVHLSVDSVSEDIRERILERRMKKVDIVDNLRQIRSYGIKTWVNYMLAIPESSLQDDIDTIVFNKKSKVSYAAYSTTSPIKGTKLYNYCIDKKYIDNVSYIGNMIYPYKKSELKCFSEKDKNIRYNIFLMGAIIQKIPFPFDKLMIIAIKYIRPNIFFLKLHDWFLKYSIENKIFKL